METLAQGFPRPQASLRSAQDQGKLHADERDAWFVMARSPHTSGSGEPTIDPRGGAVLLAAGRSTRMGGEVRKPFLQLGGRTVLEHCLRAFASAACIEEFVLVIGDEDRARGIAIAEATLGREIICVPGGAERTDSVRSGVAAVSPDCEVVLVHDVARPLVRPEHIDAVARTAGSEGAALLAVPVRDTIKRAREGRSTETLERDHLWIAQTPQGFRVPLLRDLLERAAADGGFTPTDDAALHEHYLGPVPLVEGDPSNFKLTTPSDLDMAEAVLQSREP